MEHVISVKTYISSLLAMLTFSLLLISTSSPPKASSGRYAPFVFLEVIGSANEKMNVYSLTRLLPRLLQRPIATASSKAFLIRLPIKFKMFTKFFYLLALASFIVPSLAYSELHTRDV